MRVPFVIRHSSFVICAAVLCLLSSAFAADHKVKDRNTADTDNTGNSILENYHDNGDGTFSKQIFLDIPDVTLAPTNLATSAKQDTINAITVAPSKYREPAQGATKAAIKASAGALHGYNFVNPNAYPVYVKLYNALAAGVTVGSTVPARTIAVPAGGYLTQENTGIPLTSFSTGITIAVTKLIADGDATALDTAILAEVFYK